MKKVSASVVIIIIVILVAIIVGGVFVYQYFSAKIQPVIQTQENQNNQTAGWKTYTNEKYGFELKYPNDWKYFEQGDAEKLNLPTRENGILFMSTFTVRFGKDPLNGESSDVLIYKNATFDEIIDIGGKVYIKDTETLFSVPGATKAIKFHVLLRPDSLDTYVPKGTGKDMYMILKSCNNIDTVYEIEDPQLVTSFRLTKNCTN
jgi:uncharacterized protein YxeA